MLMHDAQDGVSGLCLLKPSRMIRVRVLSADYRTPLLRLQSRTRGYVPISQYLTSLGPCYPAVNIGRSDWANLGPASPLRTPRARMALDGQSRRP